MSYKHFAKRVELRRPTDDFRQNGLGLRKLAEKFEEMSDCEFCKYVDRREYIDIIMGFAELLIASGDLVLEAAKKDWEDENNKLSSSMR